MLGSRNGVPSSFSVSCIKSNRQFALFDLDVMEPFRKLTIQVEVDSRRLGGRSPLIPFKDAWLASHTCREMLQQVLDQNLDGSDALVNTEQIALFRSKKSDRATECGPCR